MRALIVESESVLRRELVRVVGAIGGGAVVATDAAQPAMAWLRLNPHGWDLAILDIFLRNGHGFDVLKQCKKTRAHQRMVMLSNFSHEYVAGYALAAGVDRFFDKIDEMPQLIDYCKVFHAGFLLHARSIARARDRKKAASG